MHSGNARVARFILETHWGQMPEEVQLMAKICTLDLLGAIISGSATRVAGIMTKLAMVSWSGAEATILMTGRKASLPGATLANAFMANALDIDDGYRRVKGHPGAVVFPAVLAAAESRGLTGKEFLTSLVVAYEVAIRAGLAWHQYHAEYHGTGSWGALGAAAGAAKVFQLQEQEIVHALGTAEYHAPIMPMMRCIDYPAMTKDGIGWGSMVGMVSAIMAKEGFTGIPSLFGMAEFQQLVDSLGNKYEMLDLYFKPFACCRWAQPAVTGMLQLRERHNLTPERIQRVVVRTFDAATRLQLERPKNTEEAQYNMAYPIAAALAAGEVGPRQVLDENLNDPSILSVLQKVEVVRDEAYEDEFPAACRCEVEITLVNGEKVSSGPVRSLGDPDSPLGAEGVEKKFRWLAGHVLDESKVQAVVEEVMNLEKAETVYPLLKLLFTAR